MLRIPKRILMWILSLIKRIITTEVVWWVLLIGLLLMRALDAFVETPTFREDILKLITK